MKLDSLTVRNLDEFYTDLGAIGGISEAVLLQTCNRVEIFLQTHAGLQVENVIRSWALATKSNLAQLQRLAEINSGEVVVEHLVRLASGLESMIVGEPQILGQIRDSLLVARTYGACGPSLSDLFDRATSAGSRIRVDTGIGKGATTIGSAAVRLAEETLGELDRLRVLVLGTGHVGVLVMKALRARKVDNVTVAGRSREKTEGFCRTYGGTPVLLPEIKGKIQEFDLLIVATRSTSFLIDQMNLVGVRRPGKGLMILDLSNPRNVSPDVESIDGVTLCTMDDLKGIAEEGMAMRKELVKKAGPLVENAVQRISTALRRENAEPIISDFYHRAEEIRLEELGKLSAKFKLTPEQEQALEYMSQRIVEKILNGPAMNIRRAAEKGDSGALTVAGQLFAEE